MCSVKGTQVKFTRLGTDCCYDAYQNPFCRLAMTDGLSDAALAVVEAFETAPDGQARHYEGEVVAVCYQDPDSMGVRVRLSVGPEGFPEGYWVVGLEDLSSYHDERYATRHHGAYPHSADEALLRAATTWLLEHRPIDEYLVRL